MRKILFALVCCIAVNAQAIIITSEQTGNSTGTKKPATNVPQASKTKPTVSPHTPSANLVKSRNGKESVAALRKITPPSKASLGFYQASLHGNYDMMDVYLQQGADINCLNCNGGYQWTALYRTLAINGSWNFQQADWLVQRGADINIPAVIGEASGSTLVMASAGSYAPSLQALKWLIQRGADVKAIDSMGRTALHYIAWKSIDNPYGDVSEKSIAFVDLLVSNGIGINKQDDIGTTALMSAANHCAPNAVKLLISYGADAKLKTKSGKSAFDFAVDRATESGQNSPCNEVIKILSTAPQDSYSYPSKPSSATSANQQGITAYVGSYVGTYSGADNGTFQATVLQDGTAKLNGRSSKMGVSFTGEGKVSHDGSVAIGSASTGSTFIGTINPSGVLLGTWKNTTYNQYGSFQGNKGVTNAASDNPMQAIGAGLQLLNAILK